MRVIINLQYSNGNRVFSTDLEVPATAYISDLAKWVANALKIDEIDSEFEYRYTLSAPALSENTLPETETLSSIGLWDGSQLILRSQRMGRKKKIEENSVVNGRKPEAFLESTIQRYPIYSKIMWIGRSTPYTSPEILKIMIDLKDEPNADSVSRQHTQLIIEDGKYFLKIPSKNITRTFINNESPKSESPQLITDGDEIRLGRVTLRLKEFAT